MLKEELVNIKPSDKGGNIAQNRFDYQKNYIICKLLEKYNEEDFVLIIEYHDDFIIIDSKDSPESIDFFQVKTSKSANWTSTKLTKIAKSQKNSIFGKMLLHIDNFGKHTKSSNFITNIPFNIILKKDNKKSKIEKFSISELGGKCETNFHDTAKIECKSDLNKNLGTFNFEKVNLDIENHEDLTIANIVNFIEKNFDADYRARLIHDHLFREIRLKSKKESSDKSFEDIVSKRGISKSDLKDIFKSLELDKKENEKIKTIKDIIIKENFDYEIIYKYDDNIKKIRNNEMDKSDRIFFLKLKQINSIIDKEKKKLNLIDYINYIYEEFTKIPKTYTELNSESYLKTLIIYQYFKKLN